MPNRQYIEEMKVKNQQNLMVADEELSRANRNPMSSAPVTSYIAQPSNSTVKIYQDDNNKMTRYEIDKSNPNDNIKIVTINERQNQPSQTPINNVPSNNTNNINNSPVSNGTTIVKVNKKPKTPSKSIVNVDQRLIDSNNKYDPNDLGKSYVRHDEAKKNALNSNSKIIYTNSTDPMESPRKPPKTIEKIVARREEEPEPVVPLVQSYMVTQPQPVQPQPVQPQPVQPQPVQPQPAPTIVVQKPRVARQSKVPDVKEVQIDNPSLYFSSPIVTSFDVDHGISKIDPADMSKLDVNAAGDNIFVSGLQGTSKYEVGSQGITPKFRKESSPF